MQRDPIIFIDMKISELSIEQGNLIAMQVTTDDDEALFT